MPKVRVTFKECIQDSRECGSDDEYTVFRVSVDIAVDAGESLRKKEGRGV
jgi:hypothetical protein